MFILQKLISYGSDFELNPFFNRKPMQVDKGRSYVIRPFTGRNNDSGKRILDTLKSLNRSVG